MRGKKRSPFSLSSKDSSFTGIHLWERKSTAGKRGRGRLRKKSIKIDQSETDPETQAPSTDMEDEGQSPRPTPSSIAGTSKAPVTQRTQVKQTINLHAGSVKTNFGHRNSSSSPNCKCKFQQKIHYHQWLNMHSQDPTTIQHQQEATPY